MKRLILMTALLLSAVYSRAQQGMAFPFQGGKEVMLDFFKKNVVIPDEIKNTNATGTAVLKFTSDQKGVIQKIVVYYADDYSITVPIIEALKKTNHKWIIPDEEKLHDFILSFTVNMAVPTGNASVATQKKVFDSYRQRHPIFASNPVPLDMTTLLPAIIASY